MDIRPYTDEDREACLAVFDSNAPRFRPEERAEFAAFLAENSCAYLVLEHEGEIVGCGGWVREADGHSVRMTWGMVRAGMQRIGLGRLLLLHRLREITKAGGYDRVYLFAPEPVAAFFAKQGFKAVGVIRDGFAPGVDKVEMAMKLEVCR